MSTNGERDSAAEPGTPATAVKARRGESRLKPAVFIGSSVLILALSIWAIITPTGAENTIGTVVSWISAGFGWYYFLAATLYLVFVVFVAVSRYGEVKLGPQHSTPDYGVFAWAAMLFAAGIGIDLMFFSVAGPVSHYLAPPEGDPQTVEAARQAVVWTLFHYGITGWAMYALMGMALGYFSFRYRLPLAIRSALYPLIGRRIHGRIGDAVDLAAVIGTIFGISVSLGIGVVQLNYGLNFLFDVPEGVPAQIGLIIVAVLMTTVSAVAGVDRGIRRLSELNVLLAIGLMLYVLVFEGPVRLLNALILNIGDYISRFPAMTLNTFAYDQPTEWLNAWTLFFWAWWVAWAPFVGLFLARISRGRSIRQFVTATLVVPLLYTLTFLSIFGNSALSVVRQGGTEFGEITVNAPEQGFYALLTQYPGVTFSAGLATFVGLLLYVTSADSGALVMGNLSSHLPTPITDSKPWLRIFWASATGLLTLAMLLVGGVDALTNATIIMGLPFSFVMLLIIWGLYKALRTERFRKDALRTTLSSSLSERTAIGRRGADRNWRQRLTRVMSFPGKRAAAKFVDEVCRPAFRDVAEELRAQGAEASVTEGVDEEVGIPHVELRVPMDTEEEFSYRVWPIEMPTPTFATRPVTEHDTYVRFEVYLTEGSQGYDVMGYSKEQLIGNILDEYERHLEFLRLHREATARSPLPDHGPGTAEAYPAEEKEEER
ncbi:choline/glycine/proline betaine transport protein [Spinactinospora alkalitolerans]|uniref:Choline/glycine/proline betaine transport protein n=1 Tax=Spinactinospora alkalitolerans TaxID=687207 RepID=A0A852U1W3_9ACTN|nr:choline BCCT transporter BetT [Spinactinospora alkalitolerans]NYE49525.1 choline/glycine/proline betaine transport protein [Spinactinospora alkalitolerans]